MGLVAMRGSQVDGEVGQGSEERNVPDSDPKRTQTILVYQAILEK